MSHLRVGRWNPLLRTIRVREIRCEALTTGRLPMAQVDGEAAGQLPLRMRVVPEALSLLAPAWALDETPRLGKLHLPAGFFAQGNRDGNISV